jgi:hypothetical protein
MQQEHLISTEEFCTHYHVEYSFIDSLQQYGLIEITRVNESAFIDTEKLNEIEKLVRLHYDLDINLRHRSHHLFVEPHKKHAVRDNHTTQQAYYVRTRINL